MNFLNKLQIKYQKWIPKNGSGRDEKIMKKDACRNLKTKKITPS